MNLESQRILITGARGGIGRELCALLAARGARLCLLDRTREITESMTRESAGPTTETLRVEAELTRPEERQHAVNIMMQAWGGIDIIINLAGVMDFVCFHEQDPGMIQRLLQVNVEAPLQMIRYLLPHMIAQGHGRIVNIGSMFGSIGFPCFAAYSASKFAMRGFSQALRHELAGSGVGVTYIAPRAVKTPFNPPVVHRMAELGLMHMDDPLKVGKKIIAAIEKERDEAYIGFPENIFAWLNTLLPGLVGRAITRQVPALMAFIKDARA